MQIAGIARIETVTGTGTGTGTGVAVTEVGVVIATEGGVTDGTVVDREIEVVPEIGIVIRKGDHEMPSGTLLLLQMKRRNPRIRMGMWVCYHSFRK
jgi:hypothetical protein